MRRFYWWTTTKVLKIRARPSNAHLDKLHANWIREREKPPEKIDAERCQQAFDNYQHAVWQLFKPFQKGEVVPEGYLGADFRLLLTPHRPNYIYYPEMTDVIVPFDIPMSMAVSERIAEILRRFGAEEQAVQLIPVPVYEETTGLYLGRFYLVHYLLRVSGVIPTVQPEFIIPPSLRFPPLTRGEPSPSVPPACRGNLKEGVVNRRFL
jgi:hypothetical protein